MSPRRRGRPPRGRGRPGGRRRGRRREGGPQARTAPILAPPGGPIELPPTIAVQDLGERLSLSGVDVVKQLMRNGVMASLTQVVDYETAALVATDYGFQPSQAAEALRELDALRGAAVAIADEGLDTLETRPPVVTILGHVDHGKTSLLDHIRQAKVAEGEAGGITQHIGAYQTLAPSAEAGQERLITFIDTPGHEAFTAMRARGASVTDIAVLVVAADDGVMPQTIEAIDHAKAASVPIVVAINKIDRPNANPDRVKTQLIEHDLLLEEFGGDIIAVPVSAVTGEGIDDLLENILLVADVQELKADPHRLASGVIIEAHVDRFRGPVATLLVQQGTLRVGDPVVAGEVSGRVKALVDDHQQRLEEAGPAKPVEVLGFSELPQAGDPALAFPDDKQARAYAERRRLEREGQPSHTARAPILEEIYAEAETQVRELPLLIKTDVQGTAEAVRSSLERLTARHARVRVLHAAAGSINESDILLAAASNAMVVAFNTRAEPGARHLAEEQGIDIRSYTVIYQIIEDVERALTGILDPVYAEVVGGHAEVRAVFAIARRNRIAGCYVTDGKILRSDSARIFRDGELITEGTIASLKRFKDDAREVTAGLECGLAIADFDDFHESDSLEFFHMQLQEP